MNEANQANNPDASAIVPVKRKRGRPRKYPKPDLDHGINAHVPRDQNLGCVDHARVPPGFGVVNEDQPHQADPINNANDVMIGQVVHGVIEAAFDAGYLLTVRVGNSETTLRGVVFKPGHFVPVSADNDVAPGVQMIRRNEIPLPRENYIRVHGQIPPSRDRNGTTHAAQAADPAASKGKQVSAVAIQSAASGILRGNLVPVVLHPVVSLSNGSQFASEPSSVAIEAAPLMASKGKQVPDAAHPSNGLTAPKQVPIVQGNQQTMPSGVQSQPNVFSQNPNKAPHEAETKSIDVPHMPFEKLLSEVIKGTAASELTQSNSSSASKLSAKDSDVPVDDDASDTSQALSIEPLQTLQPNLHNQPASGSGPPLGNYRTGKMTELLQVLQDNMTENQVTKGEEPAVDSRPKLDEWGSHVGDDQSHSKKRSRT